MAITYTPIDILVPDIDYSLTVPSSEMEYTEVLRYWNLTDGTNTLTDGTNTLTTSINTIENVFVVKVPNVDYSLVTPKQNMELAKVYRFYNLTDGTNTLTDGTNTLTVSQAAEENIFMITVPAQNYSIIVPEEIQNA